MSASRWRDERGLTLPLVALLMGTMILMVSFAVDLGRQRSDRRLAQAGADVVALDMMRVVEGRTYDELIADQAAVYAALTASATQNDFTNTVGFVGTSDAHLPRITGLEWGTVGALQASAFTPFGPADGATVPNAVRITAERSTDYFFQPGEGGVVRTAVASIGADDLAGFEMGSFGASLDSANSGFLNALLTPLLGNPVGFDALSYQGLAAASVGVEDLAAELGVLSSDDVFSEEVTYDEALLATATILEREGGAGNVASAQLLRNAAAADADVDGPVTLGDFVSAEPGAEGSALASRINVLDLVSAPVFLAQCTDPTDPSTCSGLSMPLTGVSAGIVNLGSSARIVQGQVQHFGKVGTGTSTNQTQINLAARLTTNIPCSSALVCLTNGLLGGVVKLTVETRPVIKLADASGTIDRISCADPGALELDIATATGLYTISMVTTMKVEGLTGGLLGTTTIRQGSNAVDATDVAQFLVPPDVYGQTVVETGSGSIGLTGLSTLPAQPGDNAALLGTLGTLTGRTTAQLLTAAVNPLLTSLSTNVLGPLTDLLGVNVVGADVTPLAILCRDQGVKLVG